MWLMFCRSWCPDRTLSQARKYIAESLGPSYAEGVILDLEKTWEETDERVPLICFLSMGSDPTNSIESLAKRHKLGENLKLLIGMWVNHCDATTSYLVPLLSTKVEV
jgi:hypothetical protein